MTATNATDDKMTSDTTPTVGVRACGRSLTGIWATLSLNVASCGSSWRGAVAGVSMAVWTMAAGWGARAAGAPIVIGPVTAGRGTATAGGGASIDPVFCAAGGSGARLSSRPATTWRVGGVPVRDSPARRARLFPRRTLRMPGLRLPGLLPGPRHVGLACRVARQAIHINDIGSVEPMRRDRGGCDEDQQHGCGE